MRKRTNVKTTLDKNLTETEAVGETDRIEEDSGHGMTGGNMQELKLSTGG